jgi:hypothetical protein
MTTDNAHDVQQQIADTRSDVHSRPGQPSDDALRRVAICVAVGLVTGCVVLATTNAGSEQHTWWGWLLIGAPLTWLAFLGLFALTSGALRAFVGAVRWTLSSLTARNSTDVSVTASHWAGPQARHFDISMNELVSAA